jgi:hypothetical protein
MRARSLSDEELLGELAMSFRGTRDSEKRDAIAQEYAEAVRRLIHSGTWTEMPAPEDQLPDEHMPEQFRKFWDTPEANT